jgi:hypothetical protein
MKAAPVWLCTVERAFILSSHRSVRGAPPAHGSVQRGEELL